MPFPGNPKRDHKKAGRAGDTGSSPRKPVKDTDKSTSWGPVAGWYQEHLQGEDTYHAQVITPNLARIVAAQTGLHILDIGCGEGFFTRLFNEQGADVVGADIAKELISIAQKKSPDIEYHCAAADSLDFADSGTFDVLTCVLALQNIERMDMVFKEAFRVLRPGGRFVFVINHPAFRIPKSSSWGWDSNTQTQYRRLDTYLSSSKEKIDMTPGKQTGKSYTYSFHRSLQDYVKALSNSNFSVTRLEEWISHRSSEKGPRAKAEDIARKEFPLFLCIEAVKKA
ncbi:MAG: hypothetical protein JWO50_829 [Candidatus Kaiserbacteria bacterium]|nr:hypothetical protein [Candidatus Kaiserbacteria bacterium]